MPVNKLIVIAIAGWLALGCAQGHSGSPEATSRVGAAATLREAAGPGVPERALAVYRSVIETGRAPKGHVGGAVFQNRERHLPARGRYHEFDVNPKVQGRGRDAERIVVDLDTGRAWYTSDHYRTFIPIERSERER